MLKLYNTESRTKVPFAKREVKLYTCGPTVYNFAHIGNLRTYVFEDLLKRTLKWLGMEVDHVMNLTDVDDKTIRGALGKKTSLEAFTKIYKEAFFEDIKTLNIEPADHYPAATDYIPNMIKLIEKLMQEGIAYVGKDGSIYFSIKKFPSYGRLSHLTLDHLKVGASDRVAADEYDKEAASDFVLWKAYDKERDGLIFWESPFGPGRPGWHIECSAMAMALLGETIDIHVGGVDNIFPHHENEIAQSEACTGQCFVKHWMHSEHLLVDGKKMSKSLGNFYTLRDVLGKGFSGREMRYLLIATHYRTPLNFTFEGLSASRHALERIHTFIERLTSFQETTSVTSLITSPLEKAKNLFKEALADDLNISAALAALFDLIREVNTLMDEKCFTEQEASLVLGVLHDFDRVLGFLPFTSEPLSIPEKVQKAFEERQRARANKEWKRADELRQEILLQGFVIEDTPSGARLKIQKDSFQER
ncbi:MAG: cysteine--tRNA ligase [Simkaniaceae bacterium]|nr:cysteine--tRNA ligase [Simkaniaceae bacterium]